MQVALLHAGKRRPQWGRKGMRMHPRWRRQKGVSGGFEGRGNDGKHAKIHFYSRLFLVTRTIDVSIGAEELIAQGETLDLQRCIAIALERHPSIQAAAGTIRAGDSRIGQARSGYYPQLNGSAGYSRTDPISTSRGRAARSGDRLRQLLLQRLAEPESLRLRQDLHPGEDPGAQPGFLPFGSG